MAAPDLSSPYVIPDSVQLVVQKERERIIECMKSPVDGRNYQQAAEQLLYWQKALAEVEDFMSHFGISYY